MLAVIRDFLLEPALVTTGLLALPAFVLLFVLGRWQGTRGHAVPRPRRLVAATVLGSLLTVTSILLLFSASVLSGESLYQSIAWLTLAAGWTLVARWPGGLKKTALLLGPALALTGYALDTWITVAILFE